MKQDQLWPESYPVKEPDDLLADLPTMPREEQLEVMETWFRAHFEDPAERMPYESAEGGYIWLDGGPFDPLEELQVEFEGLVPEEIIAELADKLTTEMPEWARIADEDYFDDNYWDFVGSDQDAHATFVEAITNIEELLTSAPPYVLKSIAPLLFANAVTSMEVYLLDTFASAVFRDRQLLRRFVESNPDFKTRQVSYADIFKIHEDLIKTVKDELATVLWHNLPRVKNMYRATLGIDFGDFADLARAVTVRHDIVHRNGRTKDGDRVAIGIDKVRGVVGLVRELVEKVEHQFIELVGRPGPPIESEF